MEAVFPGSFDPITLGHLDIIARASVIFSSVTIAVADNAKKDALFTLSERVEMIKEACQSFSNVRAESFTGLLVDYVRSRNSKIIIRGLRAVSDFDFEVQTALVNRSLAKDIETFFLPTSEENSYISSSIAKQVVALGGDVKKFVTPAVAKRLQEKLK